MSQPDPCSFCGQVNVPVVVRSPVTPCVICTDCIAQCVSIMSGEMKAKAVRKTGQSPQP